MLWIETKETKTWIATGDNPERVSPEFNNTDELKQWLADQGWSPKAIRGFVAFGGCPDMAFGSTGGITNGPKMFDMWKDDLFEEMCARAERELPTSTPTEAPHKP